MDTGMDTGTDSGSTPEERAAERTKNWTDLMWHVATFVIINAFLWLIVPGAAFWVTLGWGIALAFHLAFSLIGDNGPGNRRYQKYLAQERAREKQDSI